MSPSPSTRWCPTQEQLMILEELYRRGVRTPNASQIQKITAHLAFYGKIQGKNVFYWFQNHKARDRQKMRKKLAKQMHHHQLFQHHMTTLYNTPPLPSAAPAAANLYPQLPHHQDFTSPIYPLNLHYFNPGPSNFLHQFTATHSFSAHDQTLNPQAAGSFEAALKNENWRMEIPTDWTKTRTLEADHVSLPHCNDRPLQTLELFPLKSEFSTTPQAV